jgi:hypothetical protein
MPGNKKVLHNLAGGFTRRDIYMSDSREMLKDLGKGAASGAFDALVNGGNPLRGALAGLQGVADAQAMAECQKMRPTITAFIIARIIVCAVIGLLQDVPARHCGVCRRAACVA